MSADLLQRIHMKCVEDGDCLLWMGTRGGGPRGTPQIRDNGRLLSVRRVLYEHEHGPLPQGMTAAAICESPACVRHIAPRTRSQIAQMVADTGVFAQPARCAKIAATKRAAAGRLTLEQAMDVRYGAGTAAEKAAEYGISRYLAAAIRRGERWKEYGHNPFSGLGQRT